MGVWPRGGAEKWVAAENPQADVRHAGARAGTAAATAASAAASAAAGTRTPPAPLTEDEIFQRKTLAELNAEMPLGDAFFDYGESAIRENARLILESNADYLRRWMSTRVSIEGHADSRDTSEYNLALGERRAAAVRDYLVSLGIAANRMLEVSRGEESPQCTQEEEACWQRNRRGHFVFTAK